MPGAHSEKKHLNLVMVVIALRNVQQVIYYLGRVSATANTKQ